eukprot:CAMPEP_0203765506 /NCGR_PEP_ID=MMETSP0098-20131031/18446_1 /ASSEMBLY_ACC=CAM_ASM_000208 /TAXON_ID=96639 /ORGANISM=" , Strain NY0313808BC1" /LENGTH=3436 /DNA_ID=CAMNT_0050661765 /DNA_START=196 /DNA_END=10503 /DNA_ORIENTATION=+
MRAFISKYLPGRGASQEGSENKASPRSTSVRNKKTPRSPRRNEKEVETLKRNPRSLVAFFSRGEEEDTDIEQQLKHVVEVLPSILVDYIDKHKGSIKHTVQILNGKVCATQGSNDSTVVKLLKKHASDEGLSFRTLDVLEQIVCVVPGGPDSCAAVGLPARLIESIGLYHGIRTEGASAPRHTHSVDEGELVEENLTEGEDSEGEDATASQRRLRGVLPSESIILRVSAVLCHLVQHESVQLSLIRSPDYGLDKLFRLIQGTGGEAGLLTVLESLAQDEINSAVIEHAQERKLLSIFIDYMHKIVSQHSDEEAKGLIRIMHSLTEFLRGSCRTSQVLLDAFQSLGGYVVFFDALCAMPEQNEDLLTELRAMVHFGPGFLDAEEEAERIGVVHPLFLARNDSAFAVICALLGYIQAETCMRQDYRVMGQILDKYDFAWAFVGKGTDFKRTIENHPAVLKRDELRISLLHCVMTIFSSNPVNFGRLEKFNLMPMLVTSLGAYPQVHDEFLFVTAKMLELISMGLDYRPEAVLRALFTVTFPSLVRNRRKAAKKAKHSRHSTLNFDLVAESRAPTSPPVEFIKQRESDPLAESSGVLDQTASADRNTSAFIMSVFCKTLIKMIASDVRYKDLFREAGLLSSSLFPFITQAAKTAPEEESELFEMFPEWCVLLENMLEDNLENEVALRKNKIHHDLYVLMPIRPTHVFAVFFQLAKQDSPCLDQDLSAMLELLQSGKCSRMITVRLLSTIIKMMRVNHNLKDIFRDCGGFECLLAVLVSLGSSFAPTVSTEEKDECVNVMEKVFHTLTIAMTGNHTVNRHYMQEEIRYESISATCQQIGIFGNALDSKLVDMVLDCSTEVIEIQHASKNGLETGLRIRNVAPLRILTLRISLLSQAGLGELLFRLLDMVTGSHTERASNCDIICSTLIPKILMEELFDPVFCHPEHQLHETAVQLLGCLRMYHSTTKKIKELVETVFGLNLSTDPRKKHGLMAMLRLLNVAANPDNDDAFFCPYVQMAGPSDVFVLPSKQHRGSTARQIASQASHRSYVQNNAPGNLHIAGLGSRAWPPSSGYSLSLWVWLDADAKEEILLASIRNTDGQQLLRVTLEPGNCIKCRTCGPNQNNGGVAKGASPKVDGKINSKALAAVMSAAEVSVAISSFISNAMQKKKPTSSEQLPAKTRFLNDLVPYVATFPDLNIRHGRWHHIVLVHKQTTNLGVLLDKTMNGRMTLYVDGKMQSTEKFPYTASIPTGGVKSSLFVGVDPILAATRKPTDPVRFWRLGPMILLDVPKDEDFARSLFMLGVKYTGTLTRNCATLRDVRSFTTVLLEQLYGYESGGGSVVAHLDRIGLPSDCWKQLLLFNNGFLREKGMVDVDNVVFAFYAGRQATLDGFPSIDTKSLVEKNIQEIDVPRTVLVNSATATSEEQQLLAVLGSGAFAVNPLPFCDVLRSVGAVTAILRLLEVSTDSVIIINILTLVRNLLSGHEYNRYEFRDSNGHRVLAWVLSGIAQRSAAVFNREVFETILRMAIVGNGENALIVDPEMLHQLVLNHQVWRGDKVVSEQRWRFVVVILQWLSNLVGVDNVNVELNFDALHRLNIIDWVLEILLALATDAAPDSEMITDVMTSALQFLHDLNKKKVVRRSLFELFKYILISLPVQHQQLQEQQGQESNVKNEENSNPSKLLSRSQRRGRRSTISDLMVNIQDSDQERKVEASQGAERILKQIRLKLFELLLELPESVGSEDKDAYEQHRDGMYQVYSDILSAHWFSCIIRPEVDGGTVIFAMQLLGELLQESQDFVRHFMGSGGLQIITDGLSLRKDLPTMVMFLLVLLYGIPVRVLREVSSTTSKASVDDTTDDISEFVSPKVRQKLLQRKHAMKTIRTICSKGISATFSQIIPKTSTINPPQWFVDIYSAITTMLSRAIDHKYEAYFGELEEWTTKDSETFCLEVCDVFLRTIQHYPESRNLFGSSLCLQETTGLIFQEATHLDTDDHANYLSCETFTGSISQAILKIYADLLFSAMAEDTTDIPGTPKTMENRVLNYKERSARKVLDIMMQSFPVQNITTEQRILWFQTALVQALLPQLTLIFGDEIWQARASAGSRMKLPHNVDQSKLVSVVCFITGRASFGWVPFSEHTILELMIQANRCVDIEVCNVRINRCIRGLILWTLETAKINETVDDLTQFLHAVTRNFSVMGIETPVRCAPDLGGHPGSYVSPDIVPDILANVVDLGDETILFVLCFVFLLLELIQTNLENEEVRIALIDTLTIVVKSKKDILMRDYTLREGYDLLLVSGDDERVAFREWLANLPAFNSLWLKHLWNAVQKIELFGSHKQCGLASHHTVSPRHAALFTGKRRFLFMEVAEFKRHRMRRMDSMNVKLSEDNVAAYEQLLADSGELILSTVQEAVDRHRRWQRVGLEQLLRGKRYWLAQCEQLSCGIYRELFTVPVDNINDKDGVLCDVHWMLDCTERKDRMRRKLEVNSSFSSSFIAVPLPADALLVEDADDKIDEEQIEDYLFRSIRRPSLKLVGRKRVDTDTLLGCDEIEVGTDAVVLEDDDYEDSDTGESDNGAVKLPEMLHSKGSDEPSVLREIEDFDLDGIMIDPLVEEQNQDTEKKTISIEEEMAELGWRNAERILTELDYSDRKPERILNCSTVRGLESTKAICLICAKAMYIVTNYELQETGDVVQCPVAASRIHTFEVAVLDDKYVRVLPRQSEAKKDDNQEKIDTDTLGSQATNDVQRLRYTSIREFYRKRYMFSEVGLEFFADSANFLLIFESNTDRDWVFTKILSMDLPNLMLSKASDLQDASQTSLASTDGLSLGALMAPFKRFTASVTRKWINGEISNFGYLMYLNMLAGRSHNDLTQYPVFPWILKDYSKDKLDLEDPNIYRDLSKPMGALTETRSRQFEERYQVLASSSDMEPFHYGTHYSCSAYVLQFLIRLEPYSSMALDLQSGQFDRADRLFYSLAQSWSSVSGEDLNAQDVRELIPEFFYLPEFLVNSNKFDFGNTQRDVHVDNVILPTWADGDPHKFIRIQRRALESKYVSEHLHEWIDLIFGYKQRGRAAVEALNVFHPLTYEGQVNLDDIEDPLIKQATMEQIHNFGQTPRKLFSKPHPKKVVPVVDPSKNIVGADPFAIEWHSKLAPPLVIPGGFKRPEVNDPGAQSMSKRPGEVCLVHTDTSVRFVGPPGRIGELHFCPGDSAVLALPVGCTTVNESLYLRWGSEDGSLRLYSITVSTLSYGQTTEKMAGVFECLHNGAISCASVVSTHTGKDMSIKLLTGGEDAVVSLWTLRRIKGCWQIDKEVDLCCHYKGITSICSSREQGIAVSGSKDCSVVVWDLDKLQFIRQLQQQSGCVTKVSMNESNGNIACLAGSDLSYWHVNGTLLATMIVPSVTFSKVTTMVTCNCEEYQDGIYIVTGHMNGSVALWDLPEDSEPGFKGSKW